MEKALEILKYYWNHNSFRTPQETIIEHVLNQQHVLALLPTGGGKSICFQIPTLLNEGICIVISPLIALMQDQVDALNEKGIKAMALPSGASQDELITAFDNLRYGNYKFLYLSPERLQASFIQDKIKQLDVYLIAIDEAHCISEWGHDFRPSYRHINVLCSLKPAASIIALTATATQQVIEDIITLLTLQDVAIVKKSFARKKLAYQFFKTEDKLQRLVQICTKSKKPLIVYANSRNRTKEIATFLNVKQFKASYYHGGLSSEQKQQAYDNWMSEKTPIMIATNAFGMGIDKSNVGVVVHIDLPNSIENYIQEAGRAGRDGKKSFSAVLYNDNDIRVSLDKLNSYFPSIKEVKEIYTKLFQKYHIAFGELPLDSFEFNLLEFCNSYKLSTIKVDATLKILQANGVLDLATTYNKKSTVQFLATSRQVLLYCKATNSTSNLLKLLLRSYGGIFEQETKINEFWLSKKMGIHSLKVVSILQQLHAEEIIIYNKTHDHTDLYFLVPREDDRTINSISRNITRYIGQKIQKTRDFINMVNNDEICRSIQILSYFNESDSNSCGICDVCIQKKNSYKDISSSILNFLENNAPVNSQQICFHISATEENVLLNLQLLLSEEIIAINNYNQYYIK